MSPKADVSEERQSQILDAAEEVFAEKGLDGARMDDIVEKTGLSKGALYWYFKSKDDIVIAIMERIFQFEFKQFEDLEDLEGTALMKLTTFMEVTIKDIVGMMNLMPIAYEFLSRAFRNKVVQTVIRNYFNRYIQILEPIIRQGIDSGEFGSWNAKEVALAISAVFEGTLLLWVYDSEMVDPQQHIRSSFDLLMKGVLANPDS